MNKSGIGGLTFDLIIVKKIDDFPSIMPFSVRFVIVICVPWSNSNPSCGRSTQTMTKQMSLKGCLQL